MSFGERRGGAKGPGIAGTTALLLLAVFWIATLTGEDTRQGPPSRHLEARLRRLFDNNAPGIRALALPMNGLLFLFGERRGAETVFVASSATRGRILLFTPELDLERVDSRTRAAFAHNVDVIRGQVAALRTAGVARVLLVPVPTKLSVSLAVDSSLGPQVEGLLPKGSTSARPDGSVTAKAYDEFVAAFRNEEGVDVVPLHRTFVERAANPAQPLFVYEDTHWTSLGLTVAAAETLKLWRGEQEVLLEKTGVWADIPGDLQKMLALPEHPLFRTHPMAEDVYEVRAEPRAEPCPDWVFLLGTSYSTHREQSLAGLLSWASGCTVTDVSRWGEKPAVSFEALSREHGPHLRGAVVIWEFPFRELAAP